jgi:CheY-like chemotaxis protein
MKNILFVDDEPRRMQLFVEELEACGFHVSFERDAETALAVFRLPDRRFDLIVLDISMPAGGEFAHEDTHQGLRTGLYLYDKIRLVTKEVPVVILTNVADRRVSERFDRQMNCWFFRKSDMLPFQFAEQVSQILGDDRGLPIQ